MRVKLRYARRAGKSRFLLRNSRKRLHRLGIVTEFRWAHRSSLIYLGLRLQARVRASNPTFRALWIIHCMFGALFE